MNHLRANALLATGHLKASQKHAEVRQTPPNRVVRSHQSPERLILHVEERLRDGGRKDGRLPQVSPPHLPKPLHQLIRQFDLRTQNRFALHQIDDGQQQHRLMQRLSPLHLRCVEMRKAST